MDLVEQRVILAGAAEHINKAADSLALGVSAADDQQFFLSIIEFTKSLRSAIDIAAKAAEEASKKFNQPQ